MTCRNSAAQMAPANWTTQYGTTHFMGNTPRPVKAKVTAGLMCSPDSGPQAEGVLPEPDQVAAPDRSSVFGIQIVSNARHMPFSAFLPDDVSDVAGGLGPAVFDGGLECGVVAFVLVGVGLGEVGDRLVEFAGAAEVGGQGDTVAGAGVGPGEGPSAHAGVGRHARGDHLLDRRGELPVLQLADVVVVVLSVGADHVGPAEEDVAFGLHQVLPGDHALAVAGVLAAPAVGRQGRGHSFLGLQE